MHPQLRPGECRPGHQDGGRRRRVRRHARVCAVLERAYRGCEIKLTRFWQMRGPAHRDMPSSIVLITAELQDLSTGCTGGTFCPLYLILSSQLDSLRAIRPARPCWPSARSPESTYFPVVTSCPNGSVSLLPQGPLITDSASQKVYDRVNVAIWRWDQPCCWRRQAWDHRTSVQV